MSQAMSATTAAAPRLCVMGWPVAHSLSPVMQNAALRALGLPWTYDLLPVQPPDDSTERSTERSRRRLAEVLAAAVQALRAEGFVGANVTVPYKQAIIPHLDGLTPTGRAIGAVNTLFWDTPPSSADAHPDAPIGALREAGVECKHLFGDNTDGIGFIADLTAHGIAVAERRVLVLGAGGAARAVVYALAAAGASVTIVNRTLAHAQAIAALVCSHFPAATLSCAGFPEGLASAAAGADLVVNTTSVGMWPAVDAMPWDANLAFRPDQVVYDLVYTPRMTALLRKAQMDGARVMDGLGMLVEQGAAALTRWTGRPAPVAVMRAAVEAALAQRHLANDR